MTIDLFYSILNVLGWILGITFLLVGWFIVFMAIVKSIEKVLGVELYRVWFLVLIGIYVLVTLALILFVGWDPVSLGLVCVGAVTADFWAWYEVIKSVRDGYDVFWNVIFAVALTVLLAAVGFLMLSEFGFI